MGVIYLAQVPSSGLTPRALVANDDTGVEEFYQEDAGLAKAACPYGMAMAADPSVAADVEPYGMAGIGVDDVDSAAEKARELGGHVLLPPTKVPGFGRAAVLRDPQGRAFGIFTPAP